MMKISTNLTLVFLLILISSFSVLADSPAETKESITEESGLYEEEFDKTMEEDIYAGVGKVELKGKAGLTPDSSFYFLESLVETVLVGDNPETALKYKEEKILEAKEMIESGNKEAAKKALEKSGEYNEIIRREVSPEVELQVRESSKAVKEVLNSFESELEDNQWKDVQKMVAENLKDEDKIALAAKISKQIEQLCRTLSGLDPLEYSNVCKTGDDAPKWKRELDRKLTAEQEKEAKAFFGIMSECFQNPSKCRCEEISIKPFAERCSEIAPLAAKCQAGNEDACKMMEEVEDPIDLLPDYLQDVMEEVEDRYGEAKHELSIPSECAEAGATSREACMKVMFKLNAPPECQEALEAGKINPKNEREAREVCEKIMFEANAPRECIEAGLEDHRKCENYMFKLDAPQECIEAGLTGSSKDDWKKCEAIRFKLDAPRECIEAGITGESRDDWKKCEAIKFKSEAHPDCLAAGLTGEGRDDWKKCQAIQFKADAPQECVDAGLDGSGRDDWKKCDVIRFKSEAHPDCLAAGLTGEGRDDWNKCQEIQFKADAPKECLDAGLTGKGRRDWDECNKIQENTKQQEGNIESECKDGCNQECPGASRTDCVDGYCKCYFEDDSESPDSSSGPVVSPPAPPVPSPPGDESAGAGTGDAVLPPPEGGSGGSESGSGRAETGSGSEGSSDSSSGSSNSGSGSSDSGSGSEGSNSGGSSDSGSSSESSDSGGSSESGSGSSDSGSSSSEGGAITGGAVTDWNFLKKLKGWWD